MCKNPQIDFPLEDVRLQMCYRNEAALAELEARGDAAAYLPKLQAAYGKVVLPVKDEYPYMFASLVSSFDGKMAFPDLPEGPMIAKMNRMDAKGGLADFWILNALRAYADATLVGAGTLRAEAEVWMGVYDADLVRERRKYLHKTADHPCNVIVSLDGTDIPKAHPIFAGDIPVSVFTSPAGWEVLKDDARFMLVRDEAAVGTAVTVRGGAVPVVVTGSGSSPDTRTCLRLLKAAGIHHAVVESPTYMWHLMSLGLLDEFFLNYSSVYVGGEITPGRSIPFTSAAHPHGELIYLARHGSSFLYTRQRMVYGK
jgi:riboflavin biosynthesis pyrimidine reductase